MTNSYRERFDLVLMSLIRRLNPPSIFNDWTRHTFDGEKLNVTVIPREQVYFDTTNAGPQLAEYQAKASEQNEMVMRIFRTITWPLSPSQVLSYFPAPQPPLTSIRRAITTLTNSGALVKTDQKRKGVYGRMEHVWAISDGSVGAEVKS